MRKFAASQGRQTLTYSGWMGWFAFLKAHPPKTCPRGAVRAKRACVRRLTLLVERVLPVSVLVIAVIGAPVLIFSPHGLPRLRALEKELADVDGENAELRREIESLRGRVARLRDDPRAVERTARDNLGLVRQSEVVFQFQTHR